MASSDKEHGEFAIIELIILFDHLLVWQIQRGSQSHNNAVKKHVRPFESILGERLFDHIFLVATFNGFGTHIGSFLNGHLSLLDNDVAIFENAEEHVSTDSKGQRRGNVLDKRIQLILLLHSEHDRLEVLTDLFAKTIG
jgi:hypothetical protein